VEEHLARDPELQQWAASIRDTQDALASPTASASPTALESLEMAALQRTRTLLRRRSWLFGLSLWFSLLPFTIAGRGSKVTFLLIRDHPLVGATSLALAAIGWMLYWQTRGKLNNTGFGRR
jgi:anti-sigma factor RsiW